jgi:hypothetical protein
MRGAICENATHQKAGALSDSLEAESALAERAYAPDVGEIQFVRTAGARFHTSTLDVPGPTDGAGFVYVS